MLRRSFLFFQAEDGIRDHCVTGVQTCAFFFSSRRRHTRSLCDWSSDVCSSDLSSPWRDRILGIRTDEVTAASATWIRSRQGDDGAWSTFFGGPPDLSTTVEAYVALRLAGRSEERRVGKECRSRWSPDH